MLMLILTITSRRNMRNHTGKDCSLLLEGLKKCHRHYPHDHILIGSSSWRFPSSQSIRSICTHKQNCCYPLHKHMIIKLCWFLSTQSNAVKIFANAHVFNNKSQCNGHWCSVEKHKREKSQGKCIGVWTVYGWKSQNAIMGSYRSAVHLASEKAINVIATPSASAVATTSSCVALTSRYTCVVHFVQSAHKNLCCFPHVQTIATTPKIVFGTGRVTCCFRPAVGHLTIVSGLEVKPKFSNETTREYRWIV